MKQHWYYVAVTYCPLCGRSTEVRARVYGKRPEDWDDRHSIVEAYDWCDV